MPPKSCGCGSRGTTGSAGNYVIRTAGGETKEFRSEIAANAFLASSAGATLVSAPAPAGG